MKPIASTLLLATLASPALALGETAPERPWTLMIYGAADNNADGPILEFLDGIRHALDDDPGMELILFIDRSEGFSDDARSLGEDFTGARVYRLRKDSAEHLDASSHFPGMQGGAEFEVDSSDPRHIGSFVAFCKERFPARHYGLMIYSHADGCTMCPDEASGGEMFIPQLAHEVSADASVDLLALELCNMGGIEIAYEWRPRESGFSADVLVAIPNAGPPLDWDRAFARIRSADHATHSQSPLFDPAQLSAADFGKLVVEEGYRGRQALLKQHPEHAERLGREAAACYDLRRAEPVKLAVDAFARALDGQEGSKDVLARLRGPGESGTVLNYVGDVFQERPYADLFDLGSRAASCEDLDDEVRAAARRVCKEVDGFVLGSFGMPGLKDFRQGQHGVFIVFPDGDAELRGALKSTDVWSALDWYTPLPGESERVYGRWSFLADGATPDNGVVDNWFELLDSWFDEDDDKNEYYW